MKYLQRCDKSLHCLSFWQQSSESFRVKRPMSGEQSIFSCTRAGVKSDFSFQ